MEHSPAPSIPTDLLPLFIAAAKGAAAYRMGHPVFANIYIPLGIDAGAARLSLIRDGMPMRGFPREHRLKAWAWDFGWREAAWLKECPLGGHEISTTDQEA
jgi:hypothetical protein